jgi:prepilin-type N-terminal cleavage/methylation domain-containing protein
MSSRIQHLRPRHHGFTLVELALVMGIVALLLGGLMVPLSRSLEQKAIATTQASLETAQQALLGFALLNHRLPCPDIGNAGLESTYNTVAKTCSISPTTISPAPFSDPADASWGHLPWATLGISGSDAWGNRLRYAVSTPLADTAGTTAGTTTSFRASVTSTTTSKLIAACTMVAGVTIPGCGTSAVTPASNATFVVYSHGKNGKGAFLMGSLTASAAPAGSDEIQNLPDSTVLGSTPLSRRTFVSRSHTDEKSTAGEFDDLMVWMPAPVLAAKLLAAGLW